MQFVIIILHVHDWSISELRAVYTLYILFFPLPSPPPPQLYCMFVIFWYFMMVHCVIKIDGKQIC